LWHHQGCPSHLRLLLLRLHHLRHLQPHHLAHLLVGSHPVAALLWYSDPGGVCLQPLQLLVLNHQHHHQHHQLLLPLQLLPLNHQHQQQLLLQLPLLLAGPAAALLP
jgi:hypothetical protein